MDKNIMDNTKEYYQACRDQYAGQEADRRELSTKTLAILTFCATVFGVSASLLGDDTKGNMPDSIWVMAGALIVAIVLGLCILMPGKWRQQFKISEVRDLLGKEHNDFMLAMADECKRAINYNRPKLDKNARKIQWLILAAAIEVVAFIHFQCFLLGV